VVSVFGPAGMKPELVERISSAVRDALADPDVKARIAAMGMEAQGSTSQELDAYDRSELERWRNVVKASGYVPE
jgi:tripartite-type tricarboxylate transporter receptor subunit TctC